MLWCGYAGSLFEVKIETDSNEAVGDEVTECPHDDGPRTGMFGLFNMYYATVCFGCFLSSEQ